MNSNKVNFIKELSKKKYTRKWNYPEFYLSLGLFLRYLNIYLSGEFFESILNPNDFRHQYLVDGWAFYFIAMSSKHQDIDFICTKYAPKSFYKYCRWGIGRAIYYFGDEKMYGSEIKALNGYHFARGYLTLDKSTPDLLAKKLGRAIHNLFYKKGYEEISSCLNKKHPLNCQNAVN